MGNKEGVKMRNVQMKLTPTQKKIVDSLIQMGWSNLKLTTDGNILYFPESDTESVSTAILERITLRGYKTFADKIKKLKS